MGWCLSACGIGIWLAVTVATLLYNDAAQSINLLAHAALNSPCLLFAICCRDPVRVDHIPKFPPPEMWHASAFQIRAHINIPTHTHVFALIVLFRCCGCFWVVDGARARLQIHHCQLCEHVFFLLNFLPLIFSLSTWFCFLRCSFFDHSNQVNRSAFRCNQTNGNRTGWFRRYSRAELSISVAREKKMIEFLFLSASSLLFVVRYLSVLAVPSTHQTVDAHANLWRFR